MTTYQEISTSKRFNRKFHNSCVKQTIGFIRYHIREISHGSDMSKALLKSYRATLIKNLEDRKNYKYLND